MTEMLLEGKGDSTALGLATATACSPPGGFSKAGSHSFLPCLCLGTDDSLFRQRNLKCLVLKKLENLVCA